MGPGGTPAAATHAEGIMDVLNNLATALGRRDEVPNQELAHRIAEAGDTRAVAVLVENLANRDRNIQSDCIKTLYEIGARRPELLIPHTAAFGTLLASRTQRLVWGAMIALDTIAPLEPRAVYRLLPQVLAAAECGSVIARDHAVGILATLASMKRYAAECAAHLLDQLARAPENQFPMYVEKSLAAITAANRDAFLAVINDRTAGLASETKRKRVARALRKVSATA